MSIIFMLISSVFIIFYFNAFLRVAILLYWRYKLSEWDGLKYEDIKKAPIFIEAKNKVVQALKYFSIAGIFLLLISIFLLVI